MVNLLIRVVIGIVIFLLVSELLPLVLTEVGIAVSAGLARILQILAAAIAVSYMIWGSTPVITRAAP